MRWWPICSWNRELRGQTKFSRVWAYTPNFQVCRDFLNEYAPHEINSDFNELAAAAREAARQMAVSHAKDTTQDYAEILEALSEDVREAINGGAPLGEAVSDVVENGMTRWEVEAEAEAPQVAEPPEVEVLPVETYQDLEWEFEPG